MPPDLSNLRDRLRRELPSLVAKYAVATLGIFGSFVRRENHPGSDLDVLVTFDRTPSLFLLIELENHLSDLLGVKVDLVMRDSLKTDVGRQVLPEVIPV